MIKQISLIGTLLGASIFTSISSDLPGQQAQTTKDNTHVESIDDTKEEEDLRLPESFEKIVESHVQRIMDNGNAHKLSYTDFDHGHLIMKDSSANTIDELIKDTICVLYHTRESGMDEGGGFPKEKERSLVGLMNGKVIDAKDLVGPDVLEGKIYRDFGTIYGTDVARALNGTDHHEKYWTVLYIRKSKDGEFDYKGVNYSIFLQKDPSGPRNYTREELYELLELNED